MKSTFALRFSNGLALVFALQQAACTTHATVSLENPRAALVARHGLIALVDAHGDTALVAPESEISFSTEDGDTTPTVQAGLLCRTDRGLAVRPSASAPCAMATPLIDWDAIHGAEVSTFDGAGTTAITAGIVIVIAVVAIALAAGGSESKSSSSPSKGRTAATPATGTPPPGRAGGPGGPVTPPPAVGRPDRPGSPPFLGPPHVGGVVIVPIPGTYGYPGGPRPLYDDGSLFSRSDHRRATVRGVLGLDGGVCVFSPGAPPGRDQGPCFASGLRGGVRLFNLLELTLGVRAISGWGVHDYPRAVPVLGVGLHGELPQLRWFSLELGAQFGQTSALSVYANLLLGFRVAPVTHFWIGVFPIHPVYVSWSEGRGDQWTLQSTLDLSVDF